jgi:hypothetical protein
MSTSEKWNNWYAKYKESGAIEEMQQQYRKEAAKKRENITEKICKSCNKTLPLSAFHTKVRKRKDGSLYKGYTANCKTCRNNESKTYRELNPDTIKIYRQKPETKAARRERNRLRKVLKTASAVPNWLTEKHKKEIRKIYIHAADCRAVTGEDYHVDHIVPLKGDTICGLHVPWNLQVLPADVNISKSNKWEWGVMTSK